jgi:adenosylcobyric acid synthase
VLTYLDDAGLEVASGCTGVLSGYEIHMGVTTLAPGLRPFSRIFRRGDRSVAVEDGAVSGDGRIIGTYLHGIFENERFRETYLNGIRREKGMPLQSTMAGEPLPDPFDQLAEQLEKHLDLPALLTICGLDSDPS